MKKLSLCLAFCLILTMIPIGTMLAFAEETGPWKRVNPDTGTKYYTTIDKALEEAVDGDTIYLCQNLTEAITVDFDGKTLTIEGVNLGTADAPVYPTITGTQETAITVSNVNLTLKNINAESNNTSYHATNNPVFALGLGNGAKVTLDNANLEDTGNAPTIRTTGTDTVATLTFNSGSITSKGRNGVETIADTSLQFVMNGGTITAKSYGVSANAGTIDAKIYNGSIHGDTCAITGSGMTATVYDGAFSNSSSSDYGVFNNAGNRTILGGTFSGGTSIVGGYNKNTQVKTLVFAYPEGTTSLTLKPVMQTGASIRTNTGSWGIRFRSTLPTVWLDHLKTADIAVTYGTLICPIDVLGETDFTVDNEKVLVNIVAKDGISTDGTNTVLSAALVELKTGNETRNFAARAYISFTVDGETHTVYSDFSESDHVRSMVQVAQKALADVADTAEGEYTTAVTKWYDADGNLVENSGTKYSCYSESDLEAIWSYVS